uniref:Uncharacterized protein n=1 Tax=Lepeophtheirus salmonis TaxID=72036 RepID=A0A0K2U931_LEPSM
MESHQRTSTSQNSRFLRASNKVMATVFFFGSTLITFKRDVKSMANIMPAYWSAFVLDKSYFPSRQCKGANMCSLLDEISVIVIKIVPSSALFYGFSAIGYYLFAKFKEIVWQKDI